MLAAKQTLAGPQVLRRGEQKLNARQSGTHTARLLIKQIFFKVTRGCRRGTRPFPIFNISTCWSVFPSQPWHHGPSQSHHRKMLTHVSTPSPSNSHRPCSHQEFWQSIQAPLWKSENKTSRVQLLGEAIPFRGNKRMETRSEPSGTQSLAESKDSIRPYSGICKMGIKLWPLGLVKLHAVLSALQKIFNAGVSTQ